MHKIAIFLLALTLAFMFGSQALCEEDGPVISLFATVGQGVFTSGTPEEIADNVVNMGFNQVVFHGMPYAEEPVNSIIHELKIRGVEVLGELCQFNNATIYSESVPTLANGELLTIDTFVGCCNYHAPVPIPEYYDYALEQFKLAVDTHPELDGMVMDFIRWPLNWHTRDWELGERSPHEFDSSFDPLTIARFEEGSGIDLPDNLSTAPEWSSWIYENAHEEWGQWKCSVINKFCEEAYTYLKSTGENKILGACTVPWKVSDYDEAILKIVCQDYAAMSEWVEIFLPMCYNEMMDYPISWIGEFATYCKELTNRRTVPFIMAAEIAKDICPYGDDLTPEELRESIITAVNAPGSDGVCIYEYGFALSLNRFQEVLDTIADIDVWVGVEEEKGSISQFLMLYQNSPNPFNPNTTINFSLIKAGNVTVEIFNATGQKVDTLVNESLDAGLHSVVWDSSGFSAGVYLLTLKSGDFSKSMKMTLVK